MSDLDPFADSDGTPVVYRDLAVDTETGEIVLNERGDFFFRSGVDAIRQEIHLALSTFRGEWFLDPEAGIPYFESILGVKNPRLEEIRAAFRDRLAKVPGVSSVTEVLFDFNRGTRVLQVKWSVATDLGLLSGSTQVEG